MQSSVLGKQALSGLFLLILVDCYKYIVPGNRAKIKPISVVFNNCIAPPCARELFKPSKDLASLLVCNEEKNFWFWVSGFFCE